MCGSSWLPYHTIQPIEYVCIYIICTYKRAWWWICPLMCQNRLIVAHLPTKSCCRVELWYFVFQVDNINSNTLLISTLEVFSWGQSKLYWTRVLGGAFMFIPSDLNHCWVSAYQQCISPIQLVIDDLNCLPWVPSCRELPRPLDLGY